MTDHAEEQEMEAEALEAIFDTHFAVQSPTAEGRPQWTVDIYPETASDPDELQELNHVAIQLHITLPETYPDEALPILQVNILKGLAPDPHGDDLLVAAQEEAAANEGLPCIYAIAERLREWLAENNRPGLDDISMHAQMMRKQREQELQQKKAEQEFEAQTAAEEMTAAEMEEIAVRKRRAEGTPCNTENFEAWKMKFEAEMKEVEAQKAAEEVAEGDSKKKNKDAAGAAATATAVAVASRVTGFDFFSDKTTNLEALEAAAEQAGQEEEERQQAEEDGEEDGEGLDVDEDLFDDDVDLDDLDFDDDDDDEDDDDELDI